MSLDTQFANILALTENWDSYGAYPINPERVDQARDFLAQLPDVPEPSVIPCCDGGVQIEWHLNTQDIEVYFEADGTSSFYYCTGNYEAELEAPTPTVVAELLLKA